MDGHSLSKIKKALAIKHSFENILISSKRKPNLSKLIEEKNFNRILQDFLNKINFKICSRNKDLGDAFVENFNRTVRDLLKRPVFEKSDGIWIDVLPVIRKQYNIRVHSSTPIQANFKKIEGFVYNNLIDKEKRIKPKLQVNDLVRTADLKKTFSKGDTTNWS